MDKIALKMLIGDHAKYAGLVFGIAFSTLLMSQQLSMFVGILGRTASQINDIQEADLWIMSPQVLYIDEVRTLPNRDLLRVRSTPGVLWAVPFSKAGTMVRAPGGIMHQAMLMGVDDASLIGQPPKMILGHWDDLRQPQSLVIDRAGFEFLWPKEPLSLGKVVEISDIRGVIVGISESSATFSTMPLMFSRYSQARVMSPGNRNAMSFIFVKAQPGVSSKELARRIETRTGLQAVPKEDFAWRSIVYYLKHTGIPVNFGITVTLGFIVGAAVAGQTFYLFVLENLRQFGALKAMGVLNRQILRMVCLQALVVGTIGYSIGIGLCAAFFKSTSNITALRGFYLHWQVAIITLFAIVCIVALVSMVSVRRVWSVDPAIVFKG